MLKEYLKFESSIYKIENSFLEKSFVKDNHKWSIELFGDNNHLLLFNRPFNNCVHPFELENQFFDERLYLSYENIFFEGNDFTLDTLQIQFYKWYKSRSSIEAFINGSVKEEYDEPIEFKFEIRTQLFFKGYSFYDRDFDFVKKIKTEVNGCFPDLKLENQKHGGFSLTMPRSENYKI